MTADASGVTTSVDDAIGAADASTIVTADASAIPGEIDQAVSSASPSPIPVDADTSHIDDSIDSAIAAATPAPLEVPVDAGAITDSIDAALSDVDTSGLQAELGATSSSLGEVSGAAEGASSNLDLIGPAAGFATGEVGKLTDIVKEITPGMAGAAVGAAGLAQAGDKLFASALEQDTALARLREQFGPLADAVEHVNVGGLNESLDSLATRTGANVNGLRNFTASFAELGKSAGDSTPHIADVATQINALAVRASVLNPNLGTADDIVQRLSTSLARGGPRLAAYGIALNTAAINAEALRETGKSTIAELTIYDKEVAGATLATQQLGGSLGKDINDGSEKAIVQLRKLRAAFEGDLAAAGKDSIDPVVTALKDLEPVLGAVATIFGTTLGGALHIVEPLLSIIAPLLQGTADALKAIPQPVLEGVLAFLAMQRVLPLVEGALVSLAGRVAVPAAALSGLGTEAEVAAAQTAAAGAEIEVTGVGLSGIAGPAGLAVAALIALTGSMHDTTDAAKELADKAGKELVRGFEDMVAHAQSGTSAFGQLVDFLGITTSKSEAASEIFKKIADENPAAAQRLIDALRSEGRNVDDLEPILKKSQASHRQLASDQQANAAATDQLSGVQAKAAPATDALTQSTQRLAEQQLLHLVTSGQLTNSQLEANLALHTAADGSINYATALKDLNPTMATNVDAAARLDAGLGDMRTDFQRAADAASAFQTSVDQLLTPMLNASEADARWHQELDKLTESLGKNGNTIDLNTKAGQDNTLAIDSTVRAGTAAIDKLIAEGAATDVVTAKKAEIIAKLKEEEQHYPALTPLIDGYIGKIDAIPVTHLTDTGLPNADASIAAADAVALAVGSIPPDKFIDVIANTAGAIASLGNVKAEIEAIDRIWFNSPFATNFSAQPGEPGFQRMAGGPVWPGVWTVGEAGPETLVLGNQGSGFVIPNSGTAAAPTSAGGISAADLNTLGRMIARALAAQRPITVISRSDDPVVTATAVSTRVGADAMR